MPKGRQFSRQNTKRKIIDEFAESPLATVAAASTVVMLLLQVASATGSGFSSSSSSGGMDVLGWITARGLPFKIGVFVVYFSMIGWSFGFLATLLISRNREAVPVIAHLLAIVWGLLLLSSAHGLFVDTKTQQHIYEILSLAGLIGAITLARINMDKSPRIGTAEAPHCAAVIASFTVAAVFCSVLMEI